MDLESPVCTLSRRNLHRSSLITLSVFLTRILYDFRMLSFNLLAAYIFFKVSLSACVFRIFCDFIHGANGFVTRRDLIGHIASIIAINLDCRYSALSATDVIVAKVSFKVVKFIVCQGRNDIVRGVIFDAVLSLKDVCITQ